VDLDDELRKIIHTYFSKTKIGLWVCN